MIQTGNSSCERLSEGPFSLQVEGFRPHSTILERICVALRKRDNRKTIVGRKGTLKRLGIAVTFVGGMVVFAQQAAPALDEAATAYEQGRTAEAKQKLELVLKKRPGDPGALVLMGVVLDSEQRYQEAESYYQRALRIAPDSASVLNNGANHYLAVGNRNRARDLYLRAIAIDPRHVNANLQLAEMSVKDRQGQQALAYLSRLRDAGGADPDALLLRARALALSGHCSEASEILKKFDPADGDAPSSSWTTKTWSVGPPRPPSSGTDTPYCWRKTAGRPWTCFAKLQIGSDSFFLI